MNIFFSPKSRIRTSMALARLMNTLNLLGPALLICAVTIMAFAQFGDHLPDQQQTLIKASALLVVAALVIRILWGIGVRLIVRKTANRRP